MTSALAAADRGDWVAESGRLTLGEFLTDWLDGRSRLRSATKRSYSSHVRIYLVPRLGQMKISALRPGHISSMLSDLRQTGHRGRPLSASTVQRVHATLRAALNHALRMGILTINPACLVELEPASRPVPRIWTPDELNLFLRSTRDDELHMLYRLVALTGLRRGEVVGLHWSEVDLESGTLRVVQQVVQLGSRSELSEPKTKAGRRVIKLDSATCDALRNHWDRQVALAAPGPSASTPVFSRSDGRTLSPEYVTRRFTRLSKAAGLPSIRFHDLRHGHASYALAAGVPIKVVQERLGHSSALITTDLYTHVLPAMHTAAAEQIAALLEDSDATTDTDPSEHTPLRAEDEP